MYPMCGCVCDIQVSSYQATRQSARWQWGVHNMSFYNNIVYNMLSIITSLIWKMKAPENKILLKSKREKVCPDATDCT